MPRGVDLQCRPEKLSIGERFVKFSEILHCSLAIVLVNAMQLRTAGAADVVSSIAATPAGTIVGILSNSANGPVAHATVTAAKADGSAIRATIANSEGVYSFADLSAGNWIVTAPVDGAPGITTPSIAVLAGKATRSDIAMNAPAATTLSGATFPRTIEPIYSCRAAIAGSGAGSR